MPTTNIRVTADLAIHDIQKRIKEKVELITNFASVFNQIRYLVNQLNFYDRPSNPGMISYEDFLHYFVRRLNFMGLNKELEYVFFHYDEQMTGFLDYKYFAKQLYGQVTPLFPILSQESMDSLEKIRVQVLGRNNNFHQLLRFVKRLSELPGQAEGGFLLATDFAQHISRLLDRDYKTFYWRREINNLLESFDVMKDGENVHIPTFCRYFIVSVTFGFSFFLTLTLLCIVTPSFSCIVCNISLSQTTGSHGL